MGAQLLDTTKFEKQYDQYTNRMNELDQIVVATGEPLDNAMQAEYTNLKADAEKTKKILEHFRAKNAETLGTSGSGQQNSGGNDPVLHSNRQVPGENKPRFGAQKESFEDDPKCGFRDPQEYFANVIEYGKRIQQGYSVNNATQDARIRYLSSFRVANMSGYQNLQTDDGAVAVSADLTGSVFVPIEFSPEMFKTDAGIPSGAFNTNRRTTQAMTVTKRYRLDKDHRRSVTGGFQVGRNFEQCCNKSSAAEYAPYTVTLHALYGAFVASDQLLETNPGMISQEVEEGFRTEFESNRIIEILNGQQTGEYAGIWNSNALIKVSPKSGASSGFTVGSTTLTRDDIYLMKERLWRGGTGTRKNSVWIAALDLQTPLKKLQDLSTAENTYFSFDPKGGPDWADGTLDGLPIVFTEYVPPMGFLGCLGLYNLAEYEEYTWKPIRMASSIHAKFICNQTVMKFWTYTGGRPRWDSTLIPKAIADDATDEFINSKTLSPFVLWNGDSDHAPKINRPHNKGKSATAA